MWLLASLGFLEPIRKGKTVADAFRLLLIGICFGAELDAE